MKKIDAGQVLAERITVNPDVCHGQPVIRGTRVMVWLILEYLANGDSIDDIVAAYPGITREDVAACLAYAAKAAKGRVLPVEVESHAPPYTTIFVSYLRIPMPRLQ